jgi:hypothetical protein
MMRNSFFRNARRIFQKDEEVEMRRVSDIFGNETRCFAAVRTNPWLLDQRDVDMRQVFFPHRVRLGTQDGGGCQPVRSAGSPKKRRGRVAASQGDDNAPVFFKTGVPRRLRRQSRRAERHENHSLPARPGRDLLVSFGAAAVVGRLGRGCSHTPRGGNSSRDGRRGTVRIAAKSGC